MKTQIDISVIIPVHNSSNYIKNIYVNLIKQTFNNFEVLLINDHSSDDTVNKINEIFSKFTKEWKILNSISMGVSGARNVGIKNSRGMYLAFIDDDDKLSNDYLQVLYNNAIKNRSQVVLGSYTEIMQHKEVPKLFSKSVVYSNKDIRKILIPKTIFPIKDEEEIWLPVWRTLINKDIIDKYNIKFDEKVSQAEDFLFMLEVMSKAKSVSLLAEKSIYFYNRRHNSAMNRYILSDLKKQFYFHSKFIKILNENKLYKNVQYRYLSNRVRMYSTVISNAARAEKKSQGIKDIQDAHKALVNDFYLKEIPLKKLYNSIQIKVLIKMLKHNNTYLLYEIYRYKEKRRLRKLG